MSLDLEARLIPINYSSVSCSDLDDLVGGHFVHIIESREFSDPLKNTRYIVRSGMYTCAAAAKVSFWAVSQRLGKVLGPITAVSNSLAFFVLETWAAEGIISDAFGPRSKAQVEMYQGKKRNWKKITVVPAAFSIAVASQLPTALAAAEYNPPHLKVAAAIVITITSTLIPMQSMRLSWNAIARKARTEVQEKLVKIKGEVQKLILENRNVLQGKKASELIEKLKEIQDSDGDLNDRKLGYYAALMDSKNDSEPSYLEVGGAYVDISLVDEERDEKLATLTIEDKVRLVGEGIGLALTGFLEFSLGYYTYELSKKEVDDNEAVAGILSAAAVASNLYLVGTSLQKTSGYLFSLFYRTVTKTNTPTLMGQMRPRLAFATKAIGTLIDLLGLGATIVIWSNFYDRNTAEQYSLTTLMCASIFMFVFTAMLDRVDEILELAVMLNGTEQEKELVELDRKLCQLALSLEDVPFVNFAAFVLDLPEETRDSLLAKFNLQLAEVKKVAGVKQDLELESVA